MSVALGTSTLCFIAIPHTCASEGTYEVTNCADLLEMDIVRNRHPGPKAQRPGLLTKAKGRRCWEANNQALGLRSASARPSLHYAQELD